MGEGHAMRGLCAHHFHFMGRSTMQRRAIAHPTVIILILVLQFIPLVLFPPASFSPTTQEWWLPVLLALMVLWADLELIVRRSPQVWPWYLMSFAQGLNIISRIMMLWPHATQTVGKTNVLNVPYIMLTFVSMALSAFLLWYTELPDVRLGLVKE
jgi:hypothetical protein